MWVIFLLSSIAFALVAMFIIWVGNKVMISMKKQNLKFEKEMKKESEGNKQ